MSNNADILQSLNDLRAALRSVPGGLSRLTRDAAIYFASQARGVGGARIPATPGKLPSATHLAAGISDLIGDSVKGVIKTIRPLLGDLAGAATASVAAMRKSFPAASRAFSDWFKGLFVGPGGIQVPGVSSTVRSRLAASLKSLLDGLVVAPLVAAMPGLKASFRSFGAGFKDAAAGSIGVALSGVKAAIGKFQKSFPGTSTGLGNFWSALKGNAGGFSVGLGGQVGDLLRRAGIATGRGASAFGRAATRWTGRAGRAGRKAARQLGSAFKKYGGAAAGWSGRQVRRAGAAVGRGVAGATRAAFAGASLTSTLGAFARGIGGPLGIITAGLLEAAGAARGFAERVNAGNRAMAAYNMEISASFQTLQRNEYYRDIRLAKAVETTTVSLARSTDRMRDSWASVDALTGNIQNMFGSFFAGASTAIGDKLSGPAGQADKNLKAFDPSGVFPSALGQGYTAGLMAVVQEVLTAATTPPWAVDIPGALKRIQDSIDKATAAAVNAANAPGVFGDVFARGLTAMARGGPIRGPRRMP